MLSYSQTRPAVWALDAMEAGTDGTGGRPPANDDGTPVGACARLCQFLILFVAIPILSYVSHPILRYVRQNETLADQAVRLRQVMSSKNTFVWGKWSRNRE